MSLAIVMDLTLGEPPESVHPVVGIGRAIGYLDKRAPSCGGRSMDGRQFLHGAGSVALVGGVSGSLAGIVERRTPGVSGLFGQAWLLKSCFAYRALEVAVDGVAEPLEAGDLEGARGALRSLVSRERSGMGEAEISAAAIESLAENLSDSFTAPLLAYALGGLPAAFTYRAVNTADAMIGYRGDHEYTGKFAALADDLLNLVPARMTGFAVSLAAGRNLSRSLRVMLRDHALTESPNAGWPMSAAAGALRVALEKTDHYRINPEAREPNVRDVRLAVALIRRAAAICAVICAAVSLIFSFRNITRRPR